MRRIEEGTVTTMTELLKRMADGGWGSRKGRSSLYKLHSTPIDLYVEEYFDDGKGHSDPITAIRKQVDEQLFERALRERYVSGNPELGYVSDWEFRITDLGEKVHQQRVQIANVILEQLSSGEAVRVGKFQFADKLPSFALRDPHISEEVAQDVLNWLISERYLDSHEHVGQTFYLLGLRQKVA